MAAQRSVPLAERLRPRRLDDLIGNPRARAELRAWAESWEGDRPPTARAALLFGPPGVGKTSAALALATERGWTVVEMNASDARNESSVEQVAGRASITHTLEEPTSGGRRRRALILLDEADSLSGRLTETPRARPRPASLREFLQGRYRTVEALNVAYGLRPGGKPAPFADWNGVPATPGNAGWAKLPAARADVGEWRESGRAPDLSDRGGMAAMARIVRSTRQPLVLTVNDERVLSRYSPVFRASVRRIRFYPIRDTEIRSRLDGVVREERLRVPPGALDTIVRRARGDLRAALNDLDAIASLPADPSSLAVLGGRDLAADLAALTEEVLTTPRFYRSVEVQDRIDAPPDDLLPWVEENLPHFAPDARHRDAAFVALAAAARLLNRARRFRVWSQWSYGSEVLTGGVALALHDQPVAGAGEIAFPAFLGEMGRSKGQRAVRDSVARKAGGRFHLSQRKTREAVLPFLEDLFLEARNPDTAEELRAAAAQAARELALSPEEVAYLLSVDPSSAAVKQLLSTPEPPARLLTKDREGPPPTKERSTRRRAQRDLTEFDS